MSVSAGKSKSKSWEFDPFDDGSISKLLKWCAFVPDVIAFVAELAIKAQRRKYAGFLQEYALQLKDFEDALEENPGKTWDWELDPICLRVCPTWIVVID